MSGYLHPADPANEPDPGPPAAPFHMQAPRYRQRWAMRHYGLTADEAVRYDAVRFAAPARDWHKPARHEAALAAARPLDTSAV